uniref:Protein sleepless n=1 Tax=Cacopsylla melanoneura TaxID=428564 RepID=A0A8D8TAZ3_9HEMI
MNLLFVLLPLISLVSRCSALLCYRCVSTQPGCGTPFKWLWYPSVSCPEEDDICVKIIERKGVEEIITRDCLSSVKSFRTDIPADKYEGCRASAKDPKLANYVNHSIPELDVQRNYYDSVTWCFCYFDHWCNAASAQTISTLTLLSSIGLVLLYNIH